MSTVSPLDLGHVRVHEAMHPGMISVPAHTPVREVAKLMADRHVHAVAITASGETTPPWGIVSALEVAAAAATDSDGTAGELAATEVLRVSSEDRLDHAAQLMAEHELSHLIVSDAASGHPIGVLSTLDVAAVYGFRVEGSESS